MTNVKRLDRICKKLRILWGFVPEQRLMKLILEVIAPPGAEIDPAKLYNMEDDKLENHLDKLIEGIINEKLS